MHTVGFHIRTILMILAAFSVTLSFFLILLVSSCMTASELGTKWEPITGAAGSLLVSPLSLGYLASGCSSGRLTGVCHISLLWIYDSSSEVSATGKRQEPPNCMIVISLIISLTLWLMYLLWLVFCVFPFLLILSQCSQLYSLGERRCRRSTCWDYLGSA